MKQIFHSKITLRPKPSGERGQEGKEDIRKVKDRNNSTDCLPPPFFAI